MSRKILSTIVLSVTLAGCTARAEEKPPKPVTPPPVTKPSGETVPVAPPPAESADPTQLSPNLIRAATPPTAPALAQAVQPIEAPKPVMPEFVLKALVIVDGKPPAALIEMDGKNQKLVYEGSTLTVRAGERQILSLKVNKISTDGVEIESTELKQVIHVK